MPTFLIFALVFNGFNPDTLSEANMKKGIIYSKKIFQRKRYLDSNDEKICYNLKSFVVFKANNHFIGYVIKNKFANNDVSNILKN